MMVATRTNQAWLHELTAGGSTQEAAIADLRQLLLRAALYFFSRNLSDFGGLSHDEILQRAEDCAQDALIAVLEHLTEFRGDSKFSTWVYKFAINISLTAARRERWKGVSLDALSATGEEAFFEEALPDKSNEANPEQSAIQEDIRQIVEQVIERDLTDRQRQVLRLIAFNDVPMDEVVRHLGGNRNAIYKLLHDARSKLKSGLQAQGFEVQEILNIFGVMG